MAKPGDHKTSFRKTRGPIPYRKETRSGRDYAARKTAWLEQVSKDTTLMPTAHRVAMMLPKWLNAKSEEAWPAQKTVADELGLTTRAVNKALAKLVENGHLSVKRGKRGFNGTNTYKMELSEKELATARSSSTTASSEMTNKRDQISGTNASKDDERLFGQTKEQTNKRTNSASGVDYLVYEAQLDEESPRERITDEARERILKEAFGPKCLNKYGGFQR